MNKPSVIEYFGSIKNLAGALNINQSAPCQWGTIIPEKQALRLEKLTNGALKYDPDMYRAGSP